MNKPDFYNNLFYPKEILVKVTELSLKKSCIGIGGKAKVGDIVPLSIEVTDFLKNADCKVGNFAYNFYFRTPNGINYKFYESEKQLEKSVRLSLAKRGFEFVGWKLTK